MNGMPVLEGLENDYMSGFVSFAKENYLIFLFAAMFGKFMEDSGAARTIAESLLKVIGKDSKFKVIISIVIISAVLTFGGINVFVVIFAVMPLSISLFIELDIGLYFFVCAFFI